MSNESFCPAEDRVQRSRLGQKIAELESANQMLADFAALVSHDMRGALRRVMSFTELLRVLPAIEADAHTTAFLKTISGCARKVEHLVNSILASRRSPCSPDADISAEEDSGMKSGPQTLGELQASHAALTESACAVAQELRNPLIQISGVAGMLESLPTIATNPVCRDMAAHIVAGARQMQMLIDDYLSFVQTERTALTRRRVSIMSLVQLSRHELEPLAAGRKIRWQIDPLPEVQGDPAMLQQVMLNLLSNALKYTRKCAEPTIEIGAQAGSNEWIFYVRDNGIGFDALAAQSLFRKFGRLHNESGFEGAGVGLVVVQHIIQRHGGRVWGEAVAGSGACFYFTLPMKPSE